MRDPVGGVAVSRYRGRSSSADGFVEMRPTRYTHAPQTSKQMQHRPTDEVRMKKNEMPQAIGPEAAAAGAAAGRSL